MNKRTILILGGGVGGVVAANQLRKRLHGRHRIVLVDKQLQHHFAPSFLWLMLGWRQPQQIARNLTRLLHKGVEFVQAEVKHLDAQRGVVHTNGRELNYDYLVVALGAELAPETIPGLAEVAHTVYTLEGAKRLCGALANFSGGSVAIVIASTPFKCPAAPYETALLLDYFFRERKIRPRVELQIFTPEPQPMPVAGPELGGAIRQMLVQRNIAYHPTTKLTGLSLRELTFENPNRPLKDSLRKVGVNFDLLIAIPPHRCPQPIREAGLTNETGWVTVDAGTLQTVHENIYALGDITAIKLPSGMMLPKAGVFAHAQAEVVATTIAAEIVGKKSPARFNGVGACFVEMGDGLAAYASGNFYADPKPVVKMRRPSRWHHWAKIIFEKRWLHGWF